MDLAIALDSGCSPAFACLREAFPGTKTLLRTSWPIICFAIAYPSQKDGAPAVSRGAPHPIACERLGLSVLGALLHVDVNGLGGRRLRNGGANLVGHGGDGVRHGVRGSGDVV